MLRPAAVVFVGGLCVVGISILTHWELLGAVGASVAVAGLLLAVGAAYWRAKVAESRLVLWLNDLVSGPRDRDKAAVKPTSLPGSWMSAAADHLAS